MKILRSVSIVLITILSISTLFGQAPLKKGFLRNSGSYNYSPDKSAFANYYSFSKTTGTYTNLTGAISLNNNQLWDDPEYIFPIGFDFQLFDLTIDSLYFGLGLGGVVSNRIHPSIGADYVILPFETDLIDRGDLFSVSMSPISYQLGGSPGNQILKIEWQNAGFYDEEDSIGTLNDYINFQLWLYEGTNTIEFHFESSMLTYPTINYYGLTGAFIGLTNFDLTISHFLAGDPSNPIMVDSLFFLNGTPTDGTIYKFSKNPIGIDPHRINSSFAKIYPNPFHHHTTLTINNIMISKGELKIIDIFGRTVKTISNIHTNKITFTCNELTNGIYFYHLTENAKTITSGKFILK